MTLDTLMEKTKYLEGVFSWLRFPFMIALVGIPAVVIEVILFFLAVICWAFDFSAAVWIASFLMFLIFIAWVGTAFKFAFLPSAQIQKDRTKQALGARDMSKREKDKVLSALQRFQELGHADLKVHSNFWVIDHPLPKAWTIGEDLYITRSAIDDSHLLAILSHELAHLNQGDGDTIQILRNFVYSFVSYRITGIGNLTSPKQETTQEVGDVVKIFDGSLKRFIVSAIFGGFGVIWHKDGWAEYFRAQDLKADKSVAQWGLSEDLLAYLEANKELALATPYSLNWDCWTETRIDNLLNPA